MVQKMSGGSTFAIPESGESWVEMTTSPPPIISLTEERRKQITTVYSIGIMQNKFSKFQLMFVSFASYKIFAKR